MKKNQRAWQRMLSGRRLDLLEPTPLDIEIEDIAHGLSRVARWNGQTKGKWPYSVADHSVLVEDIFCQQNKAISQRWKLACLLHDAPEYVIGDMITPFKHFLGEYYRDIEDRLCTAIHIRFGLPGTLPQWVQKAIKTADKTAAYLEATQMAGFDESEAKRHIANPKQIPDAIIHPLSPDKAKKAYLDRFKVLIKSLDQN
jgi:5'-deoxynucleotidase YfbR-like HD superfamily hydrolase